ncbi:MAG: KOW domain-containing RNA-binding protein [Clostridia bacterium]|nr:KOW domain-containing RNA-binding protein [Clostridia bacterium]
MDINLGQVVYSKAGRDAGKRFIIIAQQDDAHVLVADGDLRRLEKPKKKKIKHLNFTEEVLEQIGEKIRNKQKVTNAEIRKALVVSQDI